MRGKIRLSRANIAYAHDIFMAAVSLPLSLRLRMGPSIETVPTDFILQSTALFAIIAAAVFLPMGLYKGIWRYASMNDLIQITKAVTLAVLVFSLISFVVTRSEFLPRSLPVINWFVLMALLGGPRFIYRLVKDRHFELAVDSSGKSGIPVLLMGAGDEAETFIRAIRRQSGAAYRIVGVLDEKGRRVGRHIRDIPVLGTPVDLNAIMRRLALRGERPQRMIVTKAGLDPALMRELLDLAEAQGMTMARLPRLTAFHAGLGDEIEVKPVAVEDLLGRPQTVLDRPAMQELISGRRVLITGAGGTIGSELARQIAALGPAELGLVDSAEFNLYSIDLEIGEAAPEITRHAHLADVRNPTAMAAVFAGLKPELVFHAAALKHVPIVENHVAEAVQTNIAGSRNVADLCREHGTQIMVLISTDKAVNPTSAMGATKRVAESYCQALDRAHDDGGCRFLTVRFGNVLGSTGSVVPLFERQLAAGGPLTVTHPDITRYFMTTREAVELVLQASTLGTSENTMAGGIMVLDMGDPVKILDLAEQMIRLAGKRPHEDIDIKYVGLRPGEKLYEELFHDAESLAPTDNAAIRLATPRVADREVLVRAIDEICAAARENNNDSCRSLLAHLVPEFQSSTADTNAATAQ
ncbi:MAG: polysaccharide biosynthesis protein [Rhodospirillaceae bacterium]|jgi:O-antigen biosynthesis protein WbqV|nr:polysaccharide biosynthesis protein [Rhodospirillaceae bacterium]MBT5358028.1 polysaccharide biosynthesis protein [Rhodospirillaceae bacterium]MBT5769269.1 polysaccharide biosynthesis protein [Rhodospirillaceae bacterium]